jgi:hypothetical protein
MRRMQRPGGLSPLLLIACRMIGSPRSHSKPDDGNQLSKYRPVASFHQQHKFGRGQCLFSGAISGLRARSDCLSKVNRTRDASQTKGPALHRGCFATL